MLRRIGVSEMNVILGSLDQVDWNTLSHAYGAATDIPDVLRTFAFGSNEERQQRLEEEWWGTIIHQGTYYSATEAVVPFLIEIALADSTCQRHEIFEEVYGIAVGFIERKCRPNAPVLLAPHLPARANGIDDLTFVAGAHEAVASELPALTKLLSNSPEDQSTSVAVAFVLSTLVNQWQESLSSLLDTLNGESRMFVRVALIVAISDLLFALAHYKPEAWLRARQIVAPRWANIVKQGDDIAFEELAAATLGLLESGVELERDAALALAHRLASQQIDMPLPGIRGQMRGTSLIWDLYESLWTNPDDQAALISSALKTDDSGLFVESVRLARRHCQHFRGAPSQFVPEFDAILADDSYKEHHHLIATELIELGTQGLKAARLATAACPMARDRLRSFEQSLAFFDCDAFPDRDTESPVNETDSKMRAEIERLNALATTSSVDMTVVQDAIRDRNPKIRSAGLRAFHRLTGDHSQTVELVLEHWEQSFIAIPLLRLLGECGSAAKHLAPELRE